MLRKSDPTLKIYGKYIFLLVTIVLCFSGLFAFPSIAGPAFAQSSLPGDLNKDGKVDIFDYNILVSNYGNAVCGNVADIDGNCRVDIFDYNILVTNYGRAQATPTPIAGQCLKAMVPAYFYPGYTLSTSEYWSVLLSTLTQGEIAIINPASGPGSAKITNYQNVTALGFNKGINMAGYVHTSYGTRSLATVKAEIDSYYNWYSIKSIFLDESSSSAGNISYYQELYNYIKARGGTVVINPGTTPDESYVNAADKIVIFESDYSRYTGVTFPSWIYKYPPSKFVILVYNAPSAVLVSSITKAKNSNVGNIYITDDILPNPWDRLPSYWQSEVTGKCN